ncbi:MAG TPA: acetyl-CoA carboxylase carboxyltransferase subunit alpha [Sorangium sp.]|nr:acetyl-CoA carboxylase carboxyltransferase subunit alpha [Sorangium sp.]
MAQVVLPFEKPVVELLERIREVERLAADDASYNDTLRQLRQQVAVTVREVFAGLTPMQKVQLSRHANRPFTLDYIDRMFDDFVELRGDRRFRDDPAIVGGMATFEGRSVMVVGHQKGRGTKDNVKRNFGMPHPEGYRKAIRLFELAQRFHLPIITFIDTAGAYPGLAAEERGQSEAIGASIAAMASATVPIVAVIIGEGGSGGALALGVANKVLVLEFGCYSVITPEGCAAILWRDRALAAEAANQLKMTAQDLLRLGVVDAVVDEPTGGAHQNYDAAAELVREAIRTALDELAPLSGEALAEHRYARFRKLGAFVESAP